MCSRSLLCSSSVPEPARFTGSPAQRSKGAVLPPVQPAAPSVTASGSEYQVEPALIVPIRVSRLPPTIGGGLKGWHGVEEFTYNGKLVLNEFVGNSALSLVHPIGAADTAELWAKKSCVYSAHRCLEGNPCKNRPSGIATLEIARVVSPSSTVADIAPELIADIHLQSLHEGEKTLPRSDHVVILLCVRGGDEFEQIANCYNPYQLRHRGE